MKIVQDIFFVWVVCVCMFTCVGAHMEGKHIQYVASVWRPEVNVKCLHQSLSYILSQGLSPNLKLAVLASLATLPALRSPVSASLMLGLQMSHHTSPDFYRGSWDPNFNPHSCKASPAEPSSLPQWLVF